MSAAEHAAALGAEDWGRLGALQLTLREQLPYVFELSVCYDAEIMINIKVVVPWKSGPVPIEQISMREAKSPIPALDKIMKWAWAEYGAPGFFIRDEWLVAHPVEEHHSVRIYVISRPRPSTEAPQGNN